MVQRQERRDPDFTTAKMFIMKYLGENGEVESEEILEEFSELDAQIEFFWKAHHYYSETGIVTTIYSTPLRYTLTEEGEERYELHKDDLDNWDEY